MATTTTPVADVGFWQLLFSGSGATIAVCITIIIVAIVVYLLSRRFPQISLQYGSSKFELRREQPTIEAKVAQTAVGSELPAPITGVEKDVAGVLPAIGSEEDFGKQYFELRKAVEKQDRSQIYKIFETFKGKQVSYAPYTLEVWKYAELLRAGFDEARRELERIEKENHNDTDASQALVRWGVEGDRWQRNIKGHAIGRVFSN